MISKKFKTLVFILFYFNFLILFAYENKIIAKINDKVITSYELKNKILTTLTLANEEINQENINKSKPLVLNTLIDLKIKENEIKKYKIKISELELKNNLKIFTSTNLEDFENQFQFNNLNFELFKKDLETELAWRKLVFFLFSKKIEINDAEIDFELKQFLKSNKAKNKEFRLYELVVNFETRLEKDKKIEEIMEQINSIGFENAVFKFSESLNKNNLGDLGWVSSKSLSTNILRAIENLNIGDISEPIIISNSILFLKIKDKRHVDLNNNNIEDLKKRILNSKKDQMLSLYSNSHLSKLKNLTSIEYQ